MKILSIGNSFSHDAHRYLHEIANEYGDDVYTANLFIGGCSLETHYDNMKSGLPEYEYEVNGKESLGKTSVKDALGKEKWDIITLQQASHLSAIEETYYPYIAELNAYVRKACPGAKIFVHQTWAYENGSERLNSTGFKSTEEMFLKVRSSYVRAVETINADGVILSGEAMLKGTKFGIKVYRDGFHAGLGAGRYLLALVWYKTLTGRDITGNAFKSFDEEVTLSDRERIISIVNSIL